MHHRLTELDGFRIAGRMTRIPVRAWIAFRGEGPFPRT